MEENAPHGQVNTNALPTAQDRKFFDLMRFVVTLGSHDKVAMIMVSHSQSVCKSCNEVHARLISFTFNYN